MRRLDRLRFVDTLIPLPYPLSLQNRAAVLYRTESMLDGRGIMEPADVDTVDRQVAPMLYQIYLLVSIFFD